MNQLKIKITFTEPVLGSLNNNPEIMSEFQAARANDSAKAAEEVAALPVNVAKIATPSGASMPALKQNDTGSGGGVIDEDQTEEVEEKIEKQTTVFPRNKDGTLFCWDYQWRGFFKEALGVGLELEEKAMGSLSKWTIKKTVDSMLFIAERRISFIGEDGNPIREVKLLERPLRATTMRGERICLARSEIVPAGTQVIFSIKWFQAPSKGKKPSKMAITQDALAWALDYGLWKGFGQWRGGGYGRFSYEILSTDVAPATAPLKEAA